MLAVRVKKGFGLLSLMIAISLSSFLLLVIAHFYAQTQIQNQRIFLQLKLQTQMQSLLQLMGKDLRRAGFRAASQYNKQTKLQSNIELFEINHQSLTISQADNAPKNSCVLFFYDLSGDGCIGEPRGLKDCIKNNKNYSANVGDELFSYRLNQQAIETKGFSSSYNDYCTPAECQSYLQQSGCNDGGGWKKLIDETEIAISLLEFNWLIANQAIEINIKGHLKQDSNISYENSILVPLLNQDKQ